MLHMEIVQERLDREFNMNVITTVPNVSYFGYSKKEPEVPILINNPSEMMDPLLWTEWKNHILKLLLQNLIL
jgi:GTP-binding protein LepA